MIFKLTASWTCEIRNGPGFFLTLLNINSKFFVLIFWTISGRLFWMIFWQVFWADFFSDEFFLTSSFWQWFFGQVFWTNFCQLVYSGVFFLTSFFKQVFYDEFFWAGVSPKISGVVYETPFRRGFRNLFIGNESDTWILSHFRSILESICTKGKWLSIYLSGI